MTNIAEYGTDSVAQAVFAHILNIANRTEEHSQSAKSGGWAGCADICYCLAPLTEIAGKTLGIVGYGAIGRKVAQIAKAFGMGVVAYSPSRPAGTSDGTARFSTFDALLESSDIISLNCALNDSTKEIVNARSIARMKDGAWIVNTGRGGLVLSLIHISEPTRH